MTSEIHKLVERYQAYYGEKAVLPEAATIKVDKVAAKVAAFYERIRDIVDWSEEHLLRRGAVERILRRRLVLREPDQPLAELLLRDLIRGGYFPNGKIPETKIDEVKILLDKYLFLINNLSGFDKKQVRILNDWLLIVASCEIEETLDPPIREEALLEYMTSQMYERVTIKNHLTPEERENLIFISVRQSLFKLDIPIITHQLIKKFIPEWDQLKVDADSAALKKIAENLWRLYEKIGGLFRHPLAKKFYWLCERNDAPFSLFGDIVNEAVLDKEEGVKKLEDPAKAELLALVKYRIRAQNQKRRSARAGFYSTLSILLGKMLLAFALEMPFDIYITHEFSLPTLGLSIAIPPVLMGMLVVFGIKTPSRKNETKVIEEMKKLLAGEKTMYEIKLPTPHSFSFKAFIGLLYAVGTAVTFGFIVYALTRLEFSYFSQVVFIFFISLIAYTGSNIRQRSKELIIEEPSAGFFQSVVDFFTLSILELGRWLSGELKRIKPVSVIFNVLIELPIQFFVDFIEQWRAFLKEKKEEIIR